MHPMLMSQLSAARDTQLRTQAAEQRLGRLVVRRSRRAAQARRAAHSLRPAHA
jgi:hypothetical protein